MQELRFVWGIVGPDNQVFSGGGIKSVSKVATGVRDVSFNKAFVEAPAVCLTQIFPWPMDGSSQGGQTTDTCTIISIGVDRARVKTGDGAGNASDRAFSIIAVGP